MSPRSGEEAKTAEALIPILNRWSDCDLCNFGGGGSSCTLSFVVSIGRNVGILFLFFIFFLLSSLFVLAIVIILFYLGTCLASGYLYRLHI